MTDLAAAGLFVAPTSQASVRTASRARHSNLLSAVLCMGLAVVLTVPSSEIRAKAFKVGLIAKTARHQMHF